MVLVGSLFLGFWDKVFVPSSRACQDMKSVFGEGTAGVFVGSSQFQSAKLVVVRQGWSTCGWVDIVLEMSWIVFCIQDSDHFHDVMKVTTGLCSPLMFSFMSTFCLLSSVTYFIVPSM